MSSLLTNHGAELWNPGPGSASPPSTSILTSFYPSSFNSHRSVTFLVSDFTSPCFRWSYRSA